MNDSTEGKPTEADPTENGPTENAPALGPTENSAQKPADAPQKEPTIHLDQFLKTCGVATGGQAKVMIQGGEVLVNDEIETRRRKQLRAGDEVTLGDVVYIVTLAE